MVVGDWWDNVVITRELLCEFINWTKEDEWAIWKVRHAILAVRATFRLLKGCWGEPGIAYVLGK